MSIKIIKTVALCLGSLLMALQLHAQEVTRLSAADVATWIKGMQQAQKYSAVEMADPDVADKSVADAMARMKQGENYQEFEQSLKALGYDSVDQWVQVGALVSKAYAAVALEKQDVDAKVKQAIAEVQNNPGMSEQQKAMMIQMIQSGGQMAASLQQAPAADKAAVKAHWEALNTLFDQNAEVTP